MSISSLLSIVSYLGLFNLVNRVASLTDTFCLGRDEFFFKTGGTTDFDGVREECRNRGPDTFIARFRNEEEYRVVYERMFNVLNSPFITPPFLRTYWTGIDSASVRFNIMVYV